MTKNSPSVACLLRKYRFERLRALSVSQNSPSCVARRRTTERSKTDCLRCLAARDTAIFAERGLKARENLIEEPAALRTSFVRIDVFVRTAAPRGSTTSASDAASVDMKNSACCSRADIAVGATGFFASLGTTKKPPTPMNSTKN